MLRLFAIVLSFCLLGLSSLEGYAQGEPTAASTVESDVVSLTAEPASQATTDSKTDPSDGANLNGTTKSANIAIGAVAKPVQPISRNAISYPLLILFSSVVIALGITTAVARYLTRQPNSSFNP